MIMKLKDYPKAQIDNIGLSYGGICYDDESFLVKEFPVEIVNKDDDWDYHAGRYRYYKLIYLNSDYFDEQIRYNIQTSKIGVPYNKSKTCATIFNMNISDKFLIDAIITPAFNLGSIHLLPDITRLMKVTS